MLKRVGEFVDRNGLLGPDGCHIVAISGGADSVALLLILKRLGYRIEAAHCNFHLRGEESDRDEQFVVSLCQREDIPVHLIHFDTTTYASFHQVSIEMAARDLRYRYFEQLRQDIGASEVCVAHHQDDAVETLLMNLIRGTGIHGLTGIRPRNGHVVRPLLCVTRQEIIDFLDGMGQDYVTDSSNLVPDVVRNKIRLQVLPLLQSINPAASANIARTAQRIGDAEKTFNGAVKTAVNKLLVDNTIDIDALLREPSPESILFEILTPLGFTPSQIEQLNGCLPLDLGPLATEVMQESSTSNLQPSIFNVQSSISSSGKMFSSPTHEVLIDRRRLVIDERRAPLPTMRIPETGVYRYSDTLKFRFTTTADVTVSKDPQCATLDADKVSFPLTVRPVQQGDRFQPFGMKVSRLVSDYMTDRKRSLIDKRRQLVVTDAGGAILWLVGERTDQRFCVDAATRRVLSILIKVLTDDG